MLVAGSAPVDGQSIISPRIGESSRARSKAPLVLWSSAHVVKRVGSRAYAQLDA